MMTDAFAEQLRKTVGPEAVRQDEPMSAHTTFRIGGPADYFVRPASAEQTAAVLACCRDADVPFCILGNGSDLLVSDAGFRGVVVQIGPNLQAWRLAGERIEAQAGMLLSRLAAEAMQASLDGLTFASGIPGTVGGAVTMNAGAYGGEIRQVLRRVRVLTADLSLQDVPAEELDMGYRHSRVMDEGWIVLEAEFCLKPGDREQIERRMEELRRARQEKQPLEYPSAGSTFKRPPGYFAGKLIMDAGLAGLRIGDAQVSEKHCGFVINRGHATAADVLAVIRTVQETVLRTSGVQLEPEVRFIGP